MIQCSEPAAAPPTLGAIGRSKPRQPGGHDVRTQPGAGRRSGIDFDNPEGAGDYPLKEMSTDEHVTEDGAPVSVEVNGNRASVYTGRRSPRRDRRRLGP